MPQRPVFYFTRTVPAYRLPVIERLNERLGGRLIVCHGQPPQESWTLRDTVTGNFRQERLRNFWFNGEQVHAQPFLSVFRKYGNPSVVLAEESPRSLTLPFLLYHAGRCGAGRVLWGIFYSVFRPFSGLHPLQRYRIEMARRVEACACYTRDVRAKLRNHLPDESLFVAQNTLDTDTLFEQRERLEEEGQPSVRRRLGLPNQPTLVFVGQLVPRKGTQELLDTFSQLRRERGATLLVIGDGPERGPMEARVAAEGIRNVHFLGSIPDSETIAPYLFASDLMLLPGYVGLAINHAFSMGLPLVSQHAPAGIPFHGPEIESLVHGENGLLVARNVPGALLNGVQQVLANREQFARNAQTYAAEYLTLDNMVDGLMGAIEHAERTSR